MFLARQASTRESIMAHSMSRFSTRQLISHSSISRTSLPEAPPASSKALSHACPASLPSAFPKALSHACPASLPSASSITLSQAHPDSHTPLPPTPSAPGSIEFSLILPSISDTIPLSPNLSTSLP